MGAADLAAGTDHDELSRLGGPSSGLVLVQLNEQKNT
jgi:hypothetical protein